MVVHLFHPLCKTFVHELLRVKGARESAIHPVQKCACLENKEDEYFKRSFDCFWGVWFSVSNRLLPLPYPKQGGE